MGAPINYVLDNTQLKLYSSVYTPANPSSISDTTLVVGGGKDENLELSTGANITTLLRTVTVDSTDKPTDYQLFKAFIKNNTANSALRDIKVYVEKGTSGIGTFEIAIESKTSSEYTSSSQSPDKLGTLNLTDGTVSTEGSLKTIGGKTWNTAEDFSHALPVIDELAKGDSIAIWIKTKVTYGEVAGTFQTQITPVIYVTYRYSIV